MQFLLKFVEENKLLTQKKLINNVKVMNMTEIVDFESFKQNFKQHCFSSNEENMDDWKFAIQKKGIFLYTLEEDEEDSVEDGLSIQHSILVDRELRLKICSRGQSFNAEKDQIHLKSFSQIVGLMRSLVDAKVTSGLNGNHSHLDKLEIDHVDEEYLDESTERMVTADTADNLERNYDSNQPEDEYFQEEEYLEDSDTWSENYLEDDNSSCRDASEKTKKSLQCSTCGKIFKKHSTFRDHQNIHNNLKPYVCNICDRAFSFETSWISHEKLHKNIREYKCSHCSKAFARRRNMLLHEKLIHLREKPFACPICDRPYTDRTCLKNHIESHRSVKEPKPPLEAKPKSKQRKPLKPKPRIEPKSPQKPKDRKPRQRRNTGPKRHKCDLCDQMFARQRNVQHHMTYTHNKIKPHECQFCGKKYSDITSFKRHIRGHTDPAELRTSAAAHQTIADGEYLVDEEVLDGFSTLELPPDMNDETITFIVITES